MKYLAIFLVCIGCCKYNNSEPKYSMNEKVHYKVPVFYKSVCSGKAKVLTYITLSDDIYYWIEPVLEDRVQGCPGTLSGFRESELSK